MELKTDQIKGENEDTKDSLDQVLSEYAEYRKECDEICQEYEETIQILSESLEKFKSENVKLNTEKETMKKDNDKLIKELESAREKNRDKIKDIEILNNKLDELQSQFKAINNKEKTLKTKVVHLENDNDHYLSRLHQYEEEVTDLKDNLENTTENLIMAQKDFEEYKAQKEEELERLKAKLQEEQDNVKALMNKKLIRHKMEVTNPEEGSDGIFILKGSNTMEEKGEVVMPFDENEKKERVRLRGKRPVRKDKNNEKQNKMKGSKINYNQSEEISKLRKRREGIAKFINHIKGH